MEVIFEIIFEVILEGSAELAKNRKVPWILRLLAALILLGVFGALLALFIMMAVMGVNRGNIMQTVVGITLAVGWLAMGIYLVVVNVRTIKVKTEVSAWFSAYKPENFCDLISFFVKINKSKQYINWNWARFTWAYLHPYCDRTYLDRFVVWWQGGRIVGIAVYDMIPGEVFCTVLPGFEELLSEILNYSEENLSDKNGLRIAVGPEDTAMLALLTARGYIKTEQTERVLRLKLDQKLGYFLPEGLKIREILFPRDLEAYYRVIWKGFDHEGDTEELERMREKTGLKRPNELTYLKLAVENETGEFVAHCQCWYRKDTDYAYVEPLCVIPEYRGKGIGTAVLKEALIRCRKLGAEDAFVISEHPVYTKLGFEVYSDHVFYRKYKGENAESIIDY